MLASSRVLVLAGVCAGLLLRATPAVSVVTWQWPVDGAVVAGFAPPADRWGAGHRGVDLVATAGTAIRAMADGTVTFAGSVAGRRWVTIVHGDVRTTVGPLATVTVARDDVVAAGTVVGTALGSAHGVGDRLHVSARRGDVYVDPATLLRVGTPTLVGPGTTVATVAPPVVGPLVPGTPPSPNRLLVVAGLASTTERQPLDPADLGYGADDAAVFSYAGLDGDQPLAHDAAATWGRVHDAAVRLRDQLRAEARAHPGRGVDLVAHSLGGLVAMYYLLVLHDPTDPTLPAVGRVATIASPLTGADLATTNALAPMDPVLDALLSLADAAVSPLDREAPVLDDLRPGSPVLVAVREAWERARADVFAGPLATGTDVLAVGALLDPVVPAWRTDLDGMDTHTVMSTHGGTPRDRVTQDVLVAFLAGRPLPHGDRLDVVAGRLRPLTVLTSLAETLLPLPG